jgi:hypothetical protein
VPAKKRVRRRHLERVERVTWWQAVRPTGSPSVRAMGGRLSVKQAALTVDAMMARRHTPAPSFHSDLPFDARFDGAAGRGPPIRERAMYLASHIVSMPGRRAAMLT